MENELTVEQLDILIAERIEMVLAADPSRFRGKQGFTGPTGPIFFNDPSVMATKAEMEELRRHVDALAEGIHPTLTDGAL